MARQFLVGRGDVVDTQEAGQTAQACDFGNVFEEPMQVRHPSEVEFTWSECGHLPVEYRHRPEIFVHDVADAGVSPAEDGG